MFREVIKKAVPAVVFHLFNVTFISFIQSVLLYALAAPAYVLLLASRLEPTITSYDIAYVAIELGLVVVEIFADQQQWGMS
jgi:steroid 5-alpha reductase family enzyme